jgi:hypothetical protein
MPPDLFLTACDTLLEAARDPWNVLELVLLLARVVPWRIPNLRCSFSLSVDWEARR